jgi:hypothetical protein
VAVENTRLNVLFAPARQHRRGAAIHLEPIAIGREVVARNAAPGGDRLG